VDDSEKSRCCQGIAFDYQNPHRAKGWEIGDNDWLAKGLRISHPSANIQRVSLLLDDSKSLKILKKHEKSYHSRHRH
jgi:hypothetical protein